MMNMKMAVTEITKNNFERNIFFILLMKAATLLSETCCSFSDVSSSGCACGDLKKKMCKK